MDAASGMICSASASAGARPAGSGTLIELGYSDAYPSWIHECTHQSRDYAIGANWVVCNPRGYLPHEPNTHFDPELVASIA
jgi:hypothetical protein